MDTNKLRVKYLEKDTTTGNTDDVFGDLVGYVSANGLIFGIVHSGNMLKPVRLDYLRTIKATSAINEEG